MSKSKATENLTLKIIAVFVCFFAVIGLGLSLVGIVSAEELGVYNVGDNGWFATDDCTGRLHNHGWTIVHRYLTEEPFAYRIQSGNDAYAARNTNLRFVLKDSAGSVLCTNGSHEAAAFTSTRYYAVDGQNAMRIDGPQDGHTMVLEIGLPEELQKGDDLYDAWVIYDLLDRWQRRLPWAAFFSAMTLAVSFVYLCCAAGHREGTKGIAFNPQDRIPYDLYLLLAFWAAMVPVWGAVVVQENISRIENIWFLIVIFSLLGGMMAMIGLAVLLTTVTRLKAGKWWKNTLVWISCTLCLRLLRWIFRGMRKMLRAFRMEWRVLIGTGVFFGLLSLLLLSGIEDGVVMLWAIGLILAAMTLCCLFANRLRIVIEGGHAMALGEIDHKIDTGKLRGELKLHGEDLNSIADGLSIAVEQRMKSERMKTELITNVSHDIKTPLTSIINYVDLLKKEPLTGKAREYADTLERHANRLKKLTEDLVEASKAATGNIKAELVPTNFCELVNQAVGEYSERLAMNRIEPVVDLPEQPRYILADGRLIWRVIENLLSNAAKYAQPGTRLYVSLAEQQGRVTLEMKNISRDRLNIHADELMERFVRADSSRHTEGSGLGLNIARSLAELQGGRLAIEIDGDLFKVTLTFDELEDQPDLFGEDF